MFGYYTGMRFTSCSIFRSDDARLSIYNLMYFRHSIHRIRYFRFGHSAVSYTLGIIYNLPVNCSVINTRRFNIDHYIYEPHKHISRTLDVYVFYRENRTRLL